jgi:hypothetical protein
MAAPQPFNERFAESQYSGGIPFTSPKEQNPNRRVQRQSPRRGRSMRRSALRTTGTAMRAGGITMQAAGRAEQLAGNAMTGAGVALSTTVVGSVVGAPMAVGGRVLSVAGGVTNASGKMLSRGGRMVNRSSASKLNVANSAMSIPTAIFSASWTAKVWIMIQAPFAIMATLFLGLGYAARVLGNNFYESIKGYTGDTLAKAFSDWFANPIGGGLIAIADGLFWTCLVIAIVAGLLQICGVLATYAFRGNHAMSGSGAMWKFLAVLICFVFYVVPIFNIFPWVFLYIFVMLRYPK